MEVKPVDYKELLYRCKTKPGWLSSNEQKETESRLKYRMWINDLDEEYTRGIKAATNKLKLSNKT